jgi:hypothetical protein
MPTKVIVPSVPTEAFNPLRPPSGLLRSQIQQLQRAVYDAVDSEGEAALCIRTLTQLLEQLRPQMVPRAHLEGARGRKPASPRRSRKAPGRGRTRSKSRPDRRAGSAPSRERKAVSSTKRRGQGPARQAQTRKKR